MREILFRGIDIATGEMVTGQGINMAYDTPRLFVGLNIHTVDRRTVGQFTGLTDCDGVKIFEGDIVKTYYNGNSYEVKYGECPLFDSEGYENGYFTGLIWDDEPFSTDVYGRVDKYKVIGNIHQNPELLERTNANHN